MIKVAIAGYGNIGRGVKSALARVTDMELVAVLTRRPEQVKKEVEDTPVFHSERLSLPGDMQIDVVILCGGSKEDIPVQGPAFAKVFNTVDSFDTHSDIPGYFQQMDTIAREYGHVSIISAGWDPGIFSLERVLGDAFLPGSRGYTFWGKGVSQGHSDAARRVKGVLDARQYTIPIDGAIQQVRSGEAPDFSRREMHKRVVYVVAEDSADLEEIRREIVEMPNYYADYDTEVVFISREQMEREHATFPHGGFVLTSGLTGTSSRQILEYKCQLDSNPEFTASVLVACARAASRLQSMEYRGAFTLLDFPPGFLSPHSSDSLRSRFV